MEHERAHIDMDELMARGFTVVPGFVDAETCRRARAAIDRSLGDPTAAEPGGPDHPPPHAIREIAHPDDALAVMAAYMPKLVDANVQVLRSSAEDLRLNGQTLLRTDPSVGGAPGEPSTIVHWHVDNAFLDEHMDSTPRTYE